MVAAPPLSPLQPRGAVNPSQDQRIIQCIGRGYGARPPIAAVGQQAVSEVMLPLVGVGVGIGRASQQGQTHDVIVYIVTILAVVEQADAVVTLAQVNPLMGYRLETRPVPGCIAMGGALDIPPLDVVGGHWAQHIHRKGDFEHHMSLLPINPGVEVEAATAPVQVDMLHDLAVQEMTTDFQPNPQRPLFDNPQAVGWLSDPLLIVVKNLDIPGVSTQWAILEGLKDIGPLAGWQHLAPHRFIV